MPAIADPVFDIAIIGGGINGTGIARDAAGRGFSVYLCEQGDLASGTSSASTKLIHGGLRYLEYREFRLVRESLAERERLWGIAPHIVWPLRFVLPHRRGLRPAWLLRAGLALYDNIGGRQHLPGSRTLDLTRDEAGTALKPDSFRRGFEYSDCWVDDARLVILNARDAAGRGATIRTRTKALSAVRTRDGWTLTTENARTGDTARVRARVVVNAAGPWADKVLFETLNGGLDPNIRLVKGSHIVVPRLFAHDRPYIFQNSDGRIVFALPYEGDFTLIGTTDVDYAGDPGAAAAGPEEIAYLCRSANEYFARQIGPEDVRWSFAGVRPLYDQGGRAAQSLTRDYVLALDTSSGMAPLLSVFGGKITTYRRLAEAVLAKLEPHLPERSGKAAGWTGRTSLPGGDFPRDGVEALVRSLRDAVPTLPDGEARRLVRLYGTNARQVVAADGGRPGADFGAGLTEAEVRWLMRSEWAETAADVVWRRTKLGLKMTADEIAALDAFMARVAASRPTFARAS